MARATARTAGQVAPRPEWSTAPKLSRPPRRRLQRLGIVLGAVFLVLFAATFVVDEPLRRSLETRMNRSLKGYTVRIEKLSFHPIGLSLTLQNVVVRQDPNPDPPVLAIPRLAASVQWRELLKARLVADFALDRPKLYVNLTQLRAEAADPVPMKQKGWQQAAEAIYPLKINHVDVRDATFTYIDSDPDRPLELTRLQLKADNIRNIRSRDRFYPSSVSAEAVVFEQGRARLDGHADFLAEPFPGIHANVRLERIDLSQFRPLVARSNLSLKGGVLSLAGRIEYGPHIRGVDLADVTIDGIRADYEHTEQTAAAESRRAEEVGDAAKKASRDPETALRVARLRLTDAELGFVNRAKSPDYRVFLSGATLDVTNLSNGFRAGEATVNLRGKFMGKGDARAGMTMRPPNEAGPDFSLAASIGDTPLTSLNDLFRAYGKFDVAAGVFTFYSELKVANGRIDGYVKPLFRDMKVYDRRQDAEKSVFRKLYEKIVHGVSQLLENTERDEVATKADVSGPVDEPGTSTFQVILRLIENAFFKAILPGFEQEVARARR